MSNLNKKVREIIKDEQRIKKFYDRLFNLEYQRINNKQEQEEQERIKQEQKQREEYLNQKINFQNLMKSHARVSL